MRRGTVTVWDGPEAPLCVPVEFEQRYGAEARRRVHSVHRTRSLKGIGRLIARSHWMIAVLTLVLAGVGTGLLSWSWLVGAAVGFVTAVLTVLGVAVVWLGRRLVAHARD
jgi:hypothetical protein